MHHPNAVQFLGACTKQEPYILITELMSGGSMADSFRMMKVRAAVMTVHAACTCGVQSRDVLSAGSSTQLAASLPPLKSIATGPQQQRGRYGI